MSCKCFPNVLQMFCKCSDKFVTRLQNICKTFAQSPKNYKTFGKHLQNERTPTFKHLQNICKIFGAQLSRKLGNAIRSIAQHRWWAGHSGSKPAPACEEEDASPRPGRPGGDQPAPERLGCGPAKPKGPPPPASPKGPSRRGLGAHSAEGAPPADFYPHAYTLRYCIIASYCKYS